MKKRWKTIKNFKNIIDNMYQVSYDGEVRLKKTKQILHKKIANRKYHPYYAVNLYNNDGKHEWVLVHQLVATFFVKVSDKYLNEKDLVPDHLNNNGLDNFYLNLEWKPRSENTRDAWTKGHINTYGENSPHAIISDHIAQNICECFDAHMSYDDTLDAVGLPNTHQYRRLLIRIKNGGAYKNIVKNFNTDNWQKEYTDTQKDTISKIPEILRLISQGRKNIEIVRILWGNNLETKLEKSKAQTVSDIRKKKIFKEFL